MPTAQIEKKPRKTSGSPYPLWFFLPAGVIYGVLFLVPTFASLYFSLTRWNLFNSTFIGFENFLSFVQEPFLIKGLINTVIFAVSTALLKTIIGLALGILLTSNIRMRGLLRTIAFFPILVSTIGIGITFAVMMHPTRGIINVSLELIGIDGPGWLTDPTLALYSVAFVEVWRGVGLASVIFIAGLVSIPRDYYEAARIDGATKWQQFKRITLPLVQPATATVMILSFVYGLRSFELIWTMTKGGPGFSSDVIASVIYKQYQAGFYGLSTAGNVILFILIAVMVMPLVAYFNRREVDL